MTSVYADPLLSNSYQDVLGLARKYGINTLDNPAAGAPASKPAASGASPDYNMDWSRMTPAGASEPPASAPVGAPAPGQGRQQLRAVMGTESEKTLMQRESVRPDQIRGPAAREAYGKTVEQDRTIRNNQFGPGVETAQKINSQTDVANALRAKKLADLGLDPNSTMTGAELEKAWNDRFAPSNNAPVKRWSPPADNTVPPGQPGVVNQQSIKDIDAAEAQRQSEQMRKRSEDAKSVLEKKVYGTNPMMDFINNPASETAKSRYRQWLVGQGVADPDAMIQRVVDMQGR